MKNLHKAMILAISLLGIPSPHAFALPIEGKIGIKTFPLPMAYGGEAEIGLKDSPLRFGIQSAYVIPRYPTYYLSAWGSYTREITDYATIGLVAGFNQSWTEGRMYAPGQPLTYQGIRPVLGVSYQHQWDRVWIRTTPNVVANSSIDGRFLQLNWMDSFMTGPSWLEIGYRITPSWEVSLRSSVMPLSVSMLF